MIAPVFSSINQASCIFEMKAVSLDGITQMEGFSVAEREREHWESSGIPTVTHFLQAAQGFMISAIHERSDFILNRTSNNVPESENT